MTHRPAAIAAGVAAALCASLALALAPAASADTSTTVVSTTGLPTNWSFDNSLYPMGSGKSSYAHVHGPAGVPTGIGSLQVTRASDANSDRDSVGVGTTVSDPKGSDVTAFTLTYRSEVPIDAAIGTIMQSTQDNPYVELPASSTWSTVNLLAQPMVMIGAPADGPGPETTWPKLVADNPDMIVTGYGVDVLGVGRTWIDTVTYTSASSANTTVDFDAKPAPVLTSSTAPVAGQMMSDGTGYALISGRASASDGTPLLGLQVTLWKKEWRTTAWVVDQTVTTNEKGVFGAIAHPQKQTYYQWRVAESDTMGAATSATRYATVRALLATNFHALTVRAGTPVIVAGRMTPHLSGVTITMRSATPGAPAPKSTITNATGNYVISKVFPKAGTYKIDVVGGSNGGTNGLQNAIETAVTVHVVASK